MNTYAALPKATKLIKQNKRLTDDFKAIKHAVGRIHEFNYDPEHYYKEIRACKTSLNKVIYIVQDELDGIKAILDEMLEDTDSKEYDDWKVRE